MVDVPAVLNRFRTHIYLQTMHPDDWFADFDKLRSGRVSTSQFRRCIELTRFQLTEPEFQAIAAEFADRGMVSYRRFLDEVEDVFSNKNLEKNPHGTTMDSRSVVVKTRTCLDAATESQFMDLITKLAHQVRTRAVHVREAYMDFDTHVCGRVTASQFLRALPFRDLNQAELQLLLKTYSDPIVRDVNYKKLHMDIMEFNEHNGWHAKEQVSGLLPHQLQSIKIKGSEAPSDKLLDRFATHVRERRERIRDFFKSNDRLNLGVIPENRFKSTLTMFGFTFTKEELEHLCDRYQVVRDRSVQCDYRAFCDEIDGRADGTVTAPRERCVVEPDTSLEDVLERIRFAINRARINVLPTLQGFDRQKRGFITTPQFHRALSTLQIRVSIAELSVLAKAYSSCEDTFDYFKFVEDVDMTHGQQRRSFRPLGTTTESIQNVYGQTPTGDKFVTQDVADRMIHSGKRGLIKKVDEHRDIDGLLRSLKRWSLINSVMFHDFMRDFDKLHCGEIPISQFRSGMSMSTYQLTEDEFDTIVDYYMSESRQGMIKWRKFADDVLAAVAPKDLERVPTDTPMHPRDVVRQTTDIPDVAKVPARITRIIEIIARYVKTKRIALMDQFRDKDRMNHRRVTATHFAQVVQLLGVHVSKSEIDQLCTFYNDPKTNFVDYPLFVDEVNAQVGAIFGDRASHSIVVNPIPKYGNDESPYLVSRLSTSGHVSDWGEVCDRLRTFVFKRRVRLEDFFLAFDFHHNGKVTKQKFHSVVGQIQLPLTEQQIEVCLETFSVIGEDDMFNYRAFCREVNDVFEVKELNRTPQHNGLAASRAMADPSSTLQRLTEVQEQDVQRILTRMKGVVLTRRMNIREQFKDYDFKPHKNYITKQQFKQSIARLGLSTNPTEFDILCKKYRCTDLDDMNYQAFCNDIDPQDS